MSALPTSAARRSAATLRLPHCGNGIRRRKSLNSSYRPIGYRESRGNGENLTNKVGRSSGVCRLVYVAVIKTTTAFSRKPDRNRNRNWFNTGGDIVFLFLQRRIHYPPTDSVTNQTQRKDNENQNQQYKRCFMFFRSSGDSSFRYRKIVGNERRILFDKRIERL